MRSCDTALTVFISPLYRPRMPQEARAPSHLPSLLGRILPQRKSLYERPPQGLASLNGIPSRLADSDCPPANSRRSVRAAGTSSRAAREIWRRWRRI